MIMELCSVLKIRLFLPQIRFISFLPSIMIANNNTMPFFSTLIIKPNDGSDKSLQSEELPWNRVERWSFKIKIHNKIFKLYNKNIKSLIDNKIIIIIIRLC